MPPALQPVIPVELSYSWKGFTDADMQRVMHEALVEKRCTSLDLSWNKITDEGAAIEARAIQNNQVKSSMLIGLDMKIRRRLTTTSTERNSRSFVESCKECPLGL